MHKGHFQVSRGMTVRGGRRQSICHPALHMSQRKTREFQTQLLHYFSKSDNKSNHHQHLMFVKRTLTYLAVNIIRYRRGRDSGGEGGRGEVSIRL